MPPAVPSSPSSTEDRQRWIEQERLRAEHERSKRRFRRGRVLTSSVANKRTAAWDQRHWTSRILHQMGAITSRSEAGIVAAIAVVAWMIVGSVTGFPKWWQIGLESVTGSVTLVMVFVIQHTQERQTSATQRKLDELIRSSVHADDSLIAVEEAPDEQLQALGHLNLADRENAAAGS